MAFLVTVLLVVVALLEPVTGNTAGGAVWAYEAHSNGVLDPAHWYQGYPKCSHHHQSPIDIRNAQYVSNLYAFDMSSYQRTSNSFLELENVGGHTVEIKYPTEDILIRDGSLPDDYILAQFHFHWGSEHLVNGKRFPLEMHMVHYRKSYGTMKNAMDRSDGLAVLSFLFEVVPDDNTALNPLLKYFKDVTYKGTKKEVPAFAVSSLLPWNAATGKYYRYRGSLTTPPCYETVIWTVFDDTIKISAKQLEKFSSLQSVVKSDDDDDHTHPIVDNFRPVQQLNDREIYTNGYHNVHKRQAHFHPHFPPYGHGQSQMHHHSGGSGHQGSHSGGEGVTHSGGSSHHGSHSGGEGVTHSGGSGHQGSHSGGSGHQGSHSGGEGVTHSGGSSHHGSHSGGSGHQGSHSGGEGVTHSGGSSHHGSHSGGSGHQGSHSGGEGVTHSGGSSHHGSHSGGGVTQSHHQQGHHNQHQGATTAAD